MMLTKRYDDEQLILKKKISALRAEIDKDKKSRMNAASFLRLVRKYTDIQELTPLVLNEMVEKIVVHQAQGTGKNRTQQLDIHYNFIGVLDMPEVASLAVQRDDRYPTGRCRRVHHTQGRINENRSNLSITPVYGMFIVVMNIRHGTPDGI